MTSPTRCPLEDDVSSCPTEQAVNCCCCHYDPFDDDSPESRIKDLSFALKKLSVMKCQMRKWRLERLELESQVGMLTKCLRANGVNVDADLKVDPLVTHLRIENQKLSNHNSSLEDKIRDLQETLKERECFEDDPCKAVIYAREKMLEVRARCATEKRQLRETMADLQLKLEEASTRLANEVDQQQVSKKSIGELCAQLKKENKRLLAEVETLKKCARTNRPNTAEMSELCERVRACECEVTELRCQLVERNAVIQDLEKRLQVQRRNSTQLEKVAVSQRALGDQNVAIKAKQKQQDEKHSTQLDALKVELEKARQNNRKLEQTSEKLDNENAALRESKALFESKLAELEQRLQRGEDELRSAKEDEARMKSSLDCWQNEANKYRDEWEQIASERDELAGRVCEIEKKACDDAELLNETRVELDACCCQLDEIRRKLESAEASNAELQCSYDACTSANSELTSELEQAKAELRMLGKQLDDTKRLRDELKIVQSELDRLESTHAAVLTEKSCLKKDNEQLKKNVESLEKAKETLAADLVNVKIEMQSEKQGLSNEVRRQSADTENELNSCRSENKRLKCTINEIKRKTKAEMSKVSKALKDEMQAHIEAVTYTANLVNYSAGKVTEHPETPTQKVQDRSDKWSASEITELFDSSRILSEEISKVQELARNIQFNSKDKDESRQESQAESNQEVESKMTQMSIKSKKRNHSTSRSKVNSGRVYPCAVSPCILSPEKQLSEREKDIPFDLLSWLKSLSLTELAELHEQICGITSNIVSKDGDKLQQSIAQRQREVSARATETQLALLKEQMRLARIADEMNRESSSFALHISVDARMPSANDGPMLCCAREDCWRVGCAVDFDANRQK